MASQDSITRSDLEWMLLDKDSEPRPLQFSLLEEITDSFSDQLVIGRGGFADVYKGVLENNTVAVKKLLSNTYMYEKEFIREIGCLMKARHRNVVQFLGYCADTQGNVDSHNGKLVMANTKQRLLCFEYLPNSSLDHHISDASRGLKWSERYTIIKGICEGLNYLHQQNIMHLDLKPANILLDKDMTPKIADFGLSRCSGEDQTHLTASKIGGTIGYLAPESSSHKITPKFDLYSLGVIILEILTGKKGYQAVEDVLDSWSKRLEISQRNEQWEQIRVCTEIGMECANFKPASRPESMDHIISRLAATESAYPILADNPSELMSVQPFALFFPFEPNETITCPLHLTNNTEEPVAFRLITKGESWPSLARLPLYGVVPPRSPYTLMVIAQKQKELPDKRIIDLVLEVTRWSDEDTQTLKIHPNSRHFDTAKRIGNVVQEVSLKAVHNRRRDVLTSCKLSWPRIKITYYTGELYTQCLYSLDTNKDKQWIIVGEDKGHVRIWNYQTQRKVDSIKVSEHRVSAVKFITRKQWFVTGTDDGYIHVYSYEPKMQKIATMKVKSSSHFSLAIHPSRPYLLSSSDKEMKLWDWDKSWDCIETFKNPYNGTPKARSIISLAAFNTNETIASVSNFHAVTVRSLHSPESYFKLFGHSSNVNCLHFFTCVDKEYLVTGSDDCTAKIWDMQKRICVYTIEAFLSPVTSAVYHANLQKIIIGSEDGLAYIWSVPNSRLERIVDLGCRGAVRGLSCLMRGVAIGKEDALATLDIEQSADDYNENYMMGTGDKTCEVIVGSNTDVTILDVHPLELHFLWCETPGMSRLHLTNRTDEHVVFSLKCRTGPNHRSFLEELPPYHTVFPQSTYTLLVKTEWYKKLDGGRDLEILVQSTILGDKYIVPFANEHAWDYFFGESKELGRAVNEVSVKAFYTHNVLPQGKTTSEIICRYFHYSVTCLDVHSTEPWIIIGHAKGTFSIWNYDSQGGQFDVSVSDWEEPVCSIKFIVRKQWIVAAIVDEIHVYSCACPTKMQKITSFRTRGYVHSLAVHPTYPFVLSGSRTCELWDMDNGWKRTKIFGADLGPKRASVVAFNPENPMYFARTSVNDEVQVWSIKNDSQPKYTLSGHLKKVNCLDFFARDDAQYLISGSDDCTAKIWDLQKRKCIHTIGPLSSQVSSVSSLPHGPYLITGTKDGRVHVWSSLNFRPNRTINIDVPEHFMCLAYLMDSRRIMIKRRTTVLIMDIDDEEADSTVGVSIVHTEDEEVVANKDNNENLVLTVSKSKPPILDVHPLELEFLLGSKDSNTCSMHLTNKTDERVAFRLVDKTGSYYLGELPLHGIVLPTSTYTLIVHRKEQMKLEEATNHDMVLQSSICTLESVIKSAFDDLFGEPREPRPAVHEVSLKVVYNSGSVWPSGEATSEVILPTMKVRTISKYSTNRLCCIDVHPKKPWIITGHSEGTINLWNSQQGQHVATFKVSEESVLLAKFNAQSETVVAVTVDGSIHSYECQHVSRMQKRASNPPLKDFVIKSLDVHPVSGDMMLSSSTHFNALCWTTRWNDYTRKYLQDSPDRFKTGSNQVAFNLQDAEVIAIAGSDRQVQVWSMRGTGPTYTLSGHSDSVNCLQFFTRHDGHYLITGSDDSTAKIWDLQKRECIHTMEKETIMSLVVSVLALPDGRFLITGTSLGIVHVWSSTDFSLQRTINIGGCGPVRGLACLKGSRRVLIGQEKVLSVIDIGSEESTSMFSCISWLPSVLCSTICNPWRR